MPATERTAIDWRLRLIGLSRYTKRALLMASDFALLSFALWAGFALRFNEVYLPPSVEFALVLLAAPAIAILTYAYMGLYRLVTRYIGTEGASHIFLAHALSVLIWTLLFVMLSIDGVLPRSTIIIYAVLGSLLVWGSRQLAGLVLLGIPNVRRARFDQQKKSVIIYGAGTTGVQLLEALKRSNAYRAVAFIDGNKTLWGQRVSGVKVFKPLKLARIIEREGVEEVLLAMPEASHSRRRTIIKRLEHYNVRVKTLPTLEDIASGKVGVSDLREVGVADLLGRDPVPPDPELLARTIKGKTVLVTGAGGSIGSELARQILRLEPRQLVLLDVSEPALHEIETELRGLGLREAASADAPQQIAAVLGSVADAGLVRKTITRYGIDTIFHAAAYKHVPIVELNPVVSLKNNTFGTRMLAEIARELGVARFVLVSTDKAVRPTNIMGASKRLAELVLQAMAAEAGTTTVFTTVRFGNVLDSSGSVVRLFRRQIKAGGPVTVTHKDVVRYFMSIPEAAELVIQAGAMARGGEVFVLDMGEPIKIEALARLMIREMGRSVKDEANPDGDIGIAYIGLRPGEKLFEELLIGENTTETQHRRIQRSWEPALTLAEVDRELEALTIAMSTDDVEAIHAVLKRTVEGYAPETRHLVPPSEGQEAWQAGRRTLH